MVWICKQCGFKLRGRVIFPLHCKCGYTTLVDDNTLLTEALNIEVHCEYKDGSCIVCKQPLKASEKRRCIKKATLNFKVLKGGCCGGRGNRLPRPKVVLLTPSLRLGGAERCMLDLASNLGGEVEVLGLCVHNSEHNGVPILSVPENCKVYFGWSECDKMLCKADILIYWGLRRILLNSPACSILVIHGEGVKKDTLEEAKKFNIRIVSVSDWVARRLSLEKYSVIYNGIDTNRLEVKNYIRYPQKIIGYVGRGVYEKGVLDPARAVKELGPNFRSLYVGNISDQYRQLIRQYDSNAIFVGEIEDNIGDYYASMDCFMLGSKSEAHNLALIEAWFMHVPTITTQVGAVQELEEKYGNITIPIYYEDTAVNLASAVFLALSNEGNLIADRAREVALNKFTMSHMIKRWTQYILRTWEKEYHAS